MALRPAGAIILMFHSVAAAEAAEFIDPANRLSPRMFERQMAYLSAHRRVVPLSEVTNQLASGVSPPANTVCITFDDGYLDNLTVAAPILERYGLPATLFLATGYVGRGDPQWADALYWMFRRRTGNMIEMPLLGQGALDLTLEAARRAAQSALLHELLEASHEKRGRMLAEIERQLRPEGQMPRLNMNWDDVRRLRRRYPLFEIGGHTSEHIDLRTHRGDEAQSEIDGCAAALRRELGIEPKLFSFPYGRWCDETREMVIASGWQSAVAAGDRVRVDKNSDRYTVARGDTPRTMTELRFMTSGVYPGALRLLGLM
jgi:peptidoglycan/xylan/chitin deacetylase (PgdA/CDA1 family)